MSALVAAPVDSPVLSRRQSTAIGSRSHRACPLARGPARAIPAAALEQAADAVFAVSPEPEFAGSRRLAQS